MARGIGIGDLVAITATVRRRVTEDRVSVSIPSYNFPHSIIDHTKVKKGQQIELTGEVTRIDEETGRATVDLTGRQSARSRCVAWWTSKLRMAGNQRLSASPNSR
ncbi:hypothetical protein [Mesorhizobium muleiense]|uniref:hypothetical protein n=1 Tax=Mesorhizobium muleiense TaxID=1004279 RepID=UPI001F3FDE30|nr:hypothetical protein [Mesorhizobium muleiense]MCF6113359.1 hypothetical protein [Mesorhizobium muleiense]